MRYLGGKGNVTIVKGDFFSNPKEGRLSMTMHGCHSGQRMWLSLWT